MSSLLTAVGLGVGAGVNAYATLLTFGLLTRWRPEMFEGEVARFFSSTPVLIVLGALYVVEFLADKIPALDHVWDVIHTFIRPAAGALAGWAAVSDHLPQGWMVLATVLAGGAALTAHTAKSTLRVASTATTAGAANPVLSFVEDLFAFVNVAVAVFLPALVAMMIVLVVIAFLILMRRYRKRESL